jgi:hypothetical protein
VKASGKNYILFNIWRFYKEKEDFRRYLFISYRNNWIENEGGETINVLITTQTEVSTFAVLCSADQKNCA